MTARQTALPESNLKLQLWSSFTPFIPPFAPSFPKLLPAGKLSLVSGLLSSGRKTLAWIMTSLWWVNYTKNSKDSCRKQVFKSRKFKERVSLRLVINHEVSTIRSPASMCVFVCISVGHSLFSCLFYVRAVSWTDHFLTAFIKNMILSI